MEVNISDLYLLTARFPLLFYGSRINVIKRLNTANVIAHFVLINTKRAAHATILSRATSLLYKSEREPGGRDRSHLQVEAYLTQ